MTADEARKIEGMFGRIEARGDKLNYPIVLYGTIVKSDSYYLLFETYEDELTMFSLRKVLCFSARAKKRYLKLIKIIRQPCEDKHVLI